MCTEDLVWNYKPACTVPWPDITGKLAFMPRIFLCVEKEGGVRKIRDLKFRNIMLAGSVLPDSVCINIHAIYLPWHLEVTFIWGPGSKSAKIHVSQLSRKWQSAKIAEHLCGKLGNFFRLKNQSNLSLPHPGLVLSPPFFIQKIHTNPRLFLLLLKLILQ